MASEKLPNFNFSLPPELAVEFRRIGDVFGERNKLRWAVSAAAALKLLEMPEEEMHRLIREVAGARSYPKVLKQMVEDAKAKAEGPHKKGRAITQPHPRPEPAGTAAAGKSVGRDR